MRARQLSGRRCRGRLAAGLGWLAAEARRPAPSPRVVAVPLNRREVEAASELLLLLAGRLHDAEEPCPRAVALASFLLCDPYSPAHRLLGESDDPLKSSDRITTAQLARAALEAIDNRPLR